MLRAPAKQAIFEALDATYFGASNFTIEYGNGDPLWVCITFLPNSAFQFSIVRSAL